MATLSADVTKQMRRWVDNRVKEGLYKSRSEVIRELLREKIEAIPSKFALSRKALEKVWDNTSDDIWRDYL